MLNASLQKLNRIGLSLIHLLVPAIEYCFLRWFIHHALLLRIGWGSWLTDYDLYIPIPVAVLSFFLLQPDKQKFHAAIQRQNLIRHLGFLATFIGFNLLLTQVPLHQTTLGMTLWWGLALLSFGSSLGVWIPFRTLFGRENFLVTAYCAVMGTATVLVTHFFRQYWKEIGKTFAIGMNHVFDLISMPAHAWFTKGGIRVAHPEFNLHIGHNCGGMDAVFLATCTLVFLAFKYRSRLSFLNYVCLTLFGWTSLFILNVARLTALFSLALIFKRAWGYEIGIGYATEIFHTYSGWLFYFIGLYQLHALAHTMAKGVSLPSSLKGSAHQPADSLA